MGVPSFYRWLSRKYPKIVLDVVEERPVQVDGGAASSTTAAAADPSIHAPIDTSKPNPNGFEIDNLFLDMNGIIHPCCHPEDDTAPRDESEMIRRVFLYIDRIFHMVRPRKILYMAIDGVAPRAKMNQQRSRRFRAAKDIKDKEEAEEELRKEWEAAGKTPPQKKPRPWDSNVITPGTPFMAKLSRALHYYIMDRVSHDRGWRGIKVIFSDAKVPGEGEHKIMQFIRRQRASPGYDPNTRSCLYGMDADLIMLGLATHEPHFLIIRETITDQRNTSIPRCFLCGVMGHRADECSGVVEEETAKVEEAALQARHDGTAPSKPGIFEKPFQFLLINVLREYLAHDLFVSNLPFAWDLERVIDDFVFLCFFVGNDFLPHLPALEIREGAIERLTGIYKRMLPALGGYISEEGGKLNLSRIDVLLGELATVEDHIFRQRKSKEEYIKRRDEDRSARLQTRRQQTLAAREAALAQAEKQGLIPVQDGAVLQPHIVKQRMKEEALTPMKSTSVTPNKDTSMPSSRKRKSPGETSKVKKEHGEDTPTKVSKKVKLEDGEGVAVKVERNDEELDSEEEELEDPTYKPSPSPSDSSDEEEKRSKKRRKRQAAKKAAAKTAAAAAAASATSSPPTPSTPSHPIIPPSPSPSPPALTSISALDAASAELDFGRLLNEKLKSMYEKSDNHDETDGDGEEMDRDEVRLGEDGWKERYYQIKMNIDRQKKDDNVVFHKLFKSYAEGLSWVMRYYYDGCASWSWYYPFHYAPMASDLTSLDRYKIQFELSKPFSPIGQLMGVLPSLSAHALPEPCAELMVNPMSPIIDFYPMDFKLDLNGKKALWQAVALLPWIEEQRLLTELEKIEPKFTPEEKDRNSLGVDYIFVHKSHFLANSIYALMAQFPPEILQGKSAVECLELHKMTIDPKESGGMNGQLAPYIPVGELGGTLDSEVGLPTLEDIQCLSAIYIDPPPRIHKCQLLPGVIPPRPVLTESDFEEVNRGGRPDRNNNPNGNNHGNHGRTHVVFEHQAQHGGQAATYQPRFGEAPSHFQQQASGQRMWSSGYNVKTDQEKMQQQRRYQQQSYQHHQQYNQQSYQQPYQQQQQGYYGQQQQQQQQPYQQQNRYSFNASQQQQGYQQTGPYQTGGYAALASSSAPAPAYSHSRGPAPPPQSAGRWGHPASSTAPYASSATPASAPFSHARSAPAAAPQPQPPNMNNRFAALQQQLQQVTQAHRNRQQPAHTRW